MLDYAALGRSNTGRLTEIGVAKMTDGDIRQEAQRESPPVPCDYYLPWHEIILNGLQQGKDSFEIHDMLCAAYPTEYEDDLWALILKTKRRWDKYLHNFAPSGKAGRPRALNASAVFALVLLLKVSAKGRGYGDEDWTAAYLCDALWRWDGIEVSRKTMSRVLHEVGCRWLGNRYYRDQTTVHRNEPRFPLPEQPDSNLSDAQLLTDMITRINQQPPDLELARPILRVFLPDDYPSK